MSKMKITAVNEIRNDGKKFVPGSTFEIDATRAQRLMDEGYAKEASSKAEVTPGVPVRGAVTVAAKKAKKTAG